MTDLKDLKIQVLKQLLSLKRNLDKKELDLKVNDDEADKKLMLFCRKENHVFTKVSCHPNKKIDFIKANTIDKFNSEFDRLMPNNKDHRQVYKIMSIINDGSGLSHSCVGVTWLTEGAVINGILLNGIMMITM